MVLESRHERLEEMAEEIERDLHLLGATGIQDELQDGVPDSIASLLRAGIHIWVLTGLSESLSHSQGDRRETAVNVARSCRLLGTSSTLLVIDTNTPEETLQKLQTTKDRLSQPVVDLQSIALAISGQAIAHVLENNWESEFMAIARQVESVICFRTTPLQKSGVVEMVRQAEKSAITLAIGDGANDVSMIQKAHVGVGIRGKEGMQAALASDYAIGQFRFDFFEPSRWIFGSAAVGAWPLVLLADISRIVLFPLQEYHCGNSPVVVHDKHWLLGSDAL